MEYSKNYEKVRQFYNMKMWDLNRVKNAVVKKWITKAEYAEITGEEYNG